MKITLLPAALLAAAVVAAPAAAQDQPPADAMPLSEILAALEAGGDIAYFDEIDWDDDGHWDIEYYRPDGDEVSIDVDPNTGEPRN